MGPKKAVLYLTERAKQIYYMKVIFAVEKLTLGYMKAEAQVTERGVREFKAKPRGSQPCI